MKKESTGRIFSGIITCGSRLGYESDQAFSLDDITRCLHETNSSFQQEGKLHIPCIVTPGTLVGRAGDENYQEDVFKLGFLWSPRMVNITSEKFYGALQNYVSAIGQRMQQERIYLEFDGKTEVYRFEE